MARTTKKTDSTAPAPKPATRRSRQAAPAAPAPQTEVATVTTAPARRRRSASPQPAAKPARFTARRASARRQTAGAEPIAVVADRDTSAHSSVPVAIPEPTYAEIAERAYFVYLDRNGAPGDAADDWAQAEYQLRRERGII